MSTLDYNLLRASLIEELSLGSLAPEKQDELLSRMLESLLKRIFMGTMERLGEAGMEEYEKLLEKETDEKAVAAFLEEKIPEYDTFVNGIVEQFKKDVKAMAVESAG